MVQGKKENGLKYRQIFFDKESAKKSLIWLYTEPLFLFIWNRRNVQRLGILQGKMGCVWLQSKLWDSQFHISDNIVHSKVVSHCTIHFLLTFSLISFFLTNIALRLISHKSSSSWKVQNHKLLWETILCVGLHIQNNVIWCKKNHKPRKSEAHWHNWGSIYWEGVFLSLCPLQLVMRENSCALCFIRERRRESTSMRLR